MERTTVRIAVLGWALWASSAMAQNAEPGLASGHPPTTSPCPAATSQPLAGEPTASSRPDHRGVLTVRAVQGTKGGPAIADEPVVIELYGRGGLLRRVDAVFDKAGTVVLADLPADQIIQPIVTMTRRGATFREAGPVIEAGSGGSLTLTVYETAESAVPWQIRMRHVTVAVSAKGGLAVEELLVVENLSDRVWVGRNDSQGGQPTIVLTFPSETTQVDVYEGFDVCCTRFDEQTKQLVSYANLMPGQGRYRYGYHVPAQEGQARLSIVAPTETTQLVVMMPEDGTSRTSVEGLEAFDPPAGMSREPMRIFRASGVAAGRELVLTVSDLPVGRVAAAKASRMSKLIAGIGLGAVVVIGAVALAIRPKRPAKPKTHSTRGQGAR